MNIHQRLFRYSIVEEKYVSFISGANKCLVVNTTEEIKLNDLVRFDANNAFSENLFKITYIENIGTNKILSLERIK